MAVDGGDEVDRFAAWSDERDVDGHGDQNPTRRKAASYSGSSMRNESGFVPLMADMRLASNCMGTTASSAETASWTTGNANTGPVTPGIASPTVQISPPMAA